ncbi:MAG: molybdopterin-guanine dinucleotide biosynthesis protein B [Motiliproteus sp.]|jgi:molybdopterin-guanine dinucleotide biosynthesis protein B
MTVTLDNCPLPLLGFAAYSGTGKTTLLKQLIPLLRRQGFRIGMIKHAHHRFDVDTPGKDSYELRHAGAGQMLIASRHRWALMTETAETEEPSLNDLVSRLDFRTLDLILVEGFRHLPFPKIELTRPGLGHVPLHLDDTHIIAVATDQQGTGSPRLPELDLNDPEKIADFVANFARQQTEAEFVAPAPTASLTALADPATVVEKQP